MPLKQTISHRRALPAISAWALLATLLAAGGCSTTRQGDMAPPAPANTRSPLPAAQVADTTEPQTVTSNLPDVEGDAPATGEAMGEAPAATIMADAAPVLASTAPKSYLVQRGDTLWGLAGMFLKDPWLWPEIWYVNPEVSNPHRIFPGDTLRLANGSDGKTQVQLMPGTPGTARLGGGTRLQPLLRSSALDGPIANIPYSAIAAFLSRPGIISKQQVDAAPYIVALRDNHMIAGAGNDVYVKKLTAVAGERFKIMHVGKKLKDPDSGRVLGFLTDFTGIAQVTRAGDPARVTLSESTRETLIGDVLVPDTASAAGDLFPHAATRAVDGRILAVVNGVLLAGEFQIVAISGGSNQGLEPGHVLSVNEAGKSVVDHCARIEGIGSCSHAHKERLPVESAGTLLVFRSFDDMSYALVMSENNPLHVGDHVVTR